MTHVVYHYKRVREWANPAGQAADDAYAWLRKETRTESETDRLRVMHEGRPDLFGKRRSESKPVAAVTPDRNYRNRTVIKGEENGAEKIQTQEVSPHEEAHQEGTQETKDSECLTRGHHLKALEAEDIPTPADQEADPGLRLKGRAGMGGLKMAPAALSEPA